MPRQSDTEFSRTVRTMLWPGQRKRRSPSTIGLDDFLPESTGTDLRDMPIRRSIDLAVAVILFLWVLLTGMVATLMIGIFGGPDCHGQCRANVDLGAGLMWYSTFAVEFVVLALMVRAWQRRRAVSIWPLLSIPVLAAVGAISILFIISGPA